METNHTTRAHRKRLKRWRREEGAMPVTQCLWLTRWHRRDERTPGGATLGVQPAPIWCVVANVVTERRAGHGGIELRHGTKHFAPGAKVYCAPPLWDSYHKVHNVDHIKVVGRHRRSHRYITIVMPTEWLTNWRAQLVYSPHVIHRLQRVWQGRVDGWDGTATAKVRAEDLAAWMRG